MNNQLLDNLAPDYHPDPDYRKYLQLVSITLTVQDCAFLCALLDTQWVQPDSGEYTDQLIEIPNQIEHCVAVQELSERFNYEKSQRKSHLKWEREKRLRALIEFVYKQDYCSLHELLVLAPEVIEDCDRESDRETQRLIEGIKQ